jgi:hypothetical protein
MRLPGAKNGAGDKKKKKRRARIDIQPVLIQYPMKNLLIRQQVNYERCMWAKK